VSEHQERMRRREWSLRCTAGAITALAAAGTALLQGRNCYPPEAQELATALRDDIKSMIEDVEALAAVVQGR
jgi:hypothetical protein